MKLNRVEKALMNNPARVAIQRYHEAALMIRLMGPERLQGLRVLEIGCGRGVGTEIIFKQFGAAEIDAFDVDPAMISLARRRLVHNPTERLKLFVGDATAIQANDDTYDAVVDFGIIHHVPAWQKAVAEVSRVLKPEGVFLFEELLDKPCHAGSIALSLSTPTRELVHSGRVRQRSGVKRNSNRKQQADWFFGDFVVGIGRKSLDQKFEKQSSTSEEPVYETQLSTTH